MFSVQNYGKVPNQYQDNAEFTAAVVNDVFTAFPARYRFTSGYRTAAQNENANGVSNSFHLTAEAADFVPVNGRFSDADKTAIGEIVSKYGYEVLYHNAGSGYHVHIEPNPQGKHAPDSSSVVTAAAAGQYDDIALYAGIGLLIYLILFD